MEVFVKYVRFFCCANSRKSRKVNAAASLLLAVICHLFGILLPSNIKVTDMLSLNIEKTNSF